LSHRLTREAPAGYSPDGAVFDELLRQCVREGDIRRLVNIDPELVEEAGQCGLRPLMIGLGVLDGYEILAEELSYEGPFGVGYMVAKMKRGKRDPQRELVSSLYKDRNDRIKKVMDDESLPVHLARTSIYNFLTREQYLNSIEEFKDLCGIKAGAFVSLKKHGQLRGCIGTIEPAKDNLCEEIIHNAVSAAVSDPRFEPLMLEELDELNISVDVLEPPESIGSTNELDPKVYGVIVTRGNRRGLLLPDLPGIDFPEEQVKIAREKAGIRPGEDVLLERFKVTRYT
jgi:AmmeMemoRadiSam system protein A